MLRRSPRLMVLCLCGFVVKRVFVCCRSWGVFFSELVSTDNKSVLSVFIQSCCTCYFERYVLLDHSVCAEGEKALKVREVLLQTFT